MKIIHLLAAVVAAVAIPVSAQAGFPQISNLVVISGGIIIPECLLSGGDCDDDGVVNEKDNCVSVPNGDCDDDEARCDIDGDGILSTQERYAGKQRPAKGGSMGLACSDVDGNGVKDYLEIDSDGDGAIDLKDNCPLRPNGEQKDFDGDGIGDACDNCPVTYNPGQEDSNMDGLGDACSVVSYEGGVNPSITPDESDVPEEEEELLSEAAPYNGNCSMVAGAGSGSGAALLIWLASALPLVIRRRLRG